jgi:cardiolipin synthase A/B
VDVIQTDELCYREDVWKRSIALTLPQGLERGMHDLGYAIQPRSLRPANRVAFLRDGAETFPAMLADIAAAQQYVHLETYILRSDRVGHRFAGALAERARAGVAVRLLYDAVGSLELASSYVTDLETAGVKVCAYRPLAPWKQRWGINRRDHRKILVVDGRVGYTGGLNIGDEYDSVENGGGGWHDMHARIEGPAVADLARLFRRTWLAGGGDAYPQHEEPAEESVASDGTAFAIALGNEELRKRANIRAAYLHAMRRARQTIGIANAYFIADRGIRRVMANAVARGVRVDLILPGHSDLRSVKYAGQHVYSALLKAGVRIFEWSGKMMHAKAAVVDGVWAAIGSYNLDARSLFHNLEVVLCVVDRGFASGLRAQLEDDRAHSREVVLSEWRKRPFWSKVLEWLCYQFRHWL